MREIKFEILLKATENPENGYKEGDTVKLVNDIFCKDNGVAFWNINPKAWEIVYNRQYTGLKDKNGKEIYEGDILHFVTSKKRGFPTEGIDVFYTVKFGTHNTTDDALHRSQGFYAGRNGETETSLSYVVNSLEGCVLGNIHEAKEPIKDTK